MESDLEALRDEIRRAGRMTCGIRWSAAGCLLMPFVLVALLIWSLPCIGPGSTIGPFSATEFAEAAPGAIFGVLFSGAVALPLALGYRRRLREFRRRLETRPDSQ